MSRPVIAIPSRFSASASALRYRAEVGARGVLESVFAAGGEPVLMHPHAPGGIIDENAVRERIAFADGVLLPGGGDLAAHWYGMAAHDSTYDVDDEQDAFDLALARVCLADGIPLFAICRGLQVVNVALGGTLVQHMGQAGTSSATSGSTANPVDNDSTVKSAGISAEALAAGHMNLLHTVAIAPGSLLAEMVPDKITASCFHHQCVADPGEGMVAVATSDDGTPEAFTVPDAAGWFVGVQWHPEDTAATDPDQAAVFAAHVAAAAARRAAR